MLIDITRMWSDSGSTIVFGEGFNLMGEQVTFAGDRRPMVEATEMWKADVQATFNESGDTDDARRPLLMEIETWQVIEIEAAT